MYPLVKDKLKEIEKSVLRINYDKDIEYYVCQDCCYEFFEILTPLLFNGVPICRNCYNKRQKLNLENTNTEN